MTNSPPPPAPPAAPHALGYQSPFGNTDTPIWFNGKHVVTLDRVVFPARCIKCNGSNDLKTTVKKLAWFPPWMCLLLIFPGIFLGGFIFLGMLFAAVTIIGIIQSHYRAAVCVAICRECRKRRLKHILIAWMLLFVSVAAFLTSINLRQGLIAMLGVALFLASAVYAAVVCALITPVKIAGNIVTLKGVGSAFTATLDVRR